MSNQLLAAKFAVIGLILLPAAAPTFAQKGAASPPSMDRHSNRARERQQDMSAREWQLRNFGNPSLVKDRRRLEALMAQTEEDFNRMLMLHNEIARAITANKPIDYHFVSEASGEIRKRATSIQSNLQLSPPAEEVTKTAMPPEMKDALIKLCKQIRSFVTNPIIEQPNTINVEKLADAKRDLDSVIQLSAHLKREADVLIKVQK